MFTLNEALKIAGLPQKEVVDLNEATEEQIDAILTKIKSKTGGSFGVVSAYWTGGDAKGLEAYIDKLEKSGFDTAGAWSENQEWFKKNDITKAEYMALVKYSQ